MCSSSSTPFREIQTDTGSVGLELGGWWRLRQAGGHGWSSFHERRRGVSGRGTSSLRPSSFVPIVTDPMSSHSAFASPPWCARVRATRASETFGLVVPSPPSLAPASFLPASLPFFPSFFPSFSFPLSSWGKSGVALAALSLSLSLSAHHKLLQSEVGISISLSIFGKFFRRFFFKSSPAHEGRVRQSVCATVLQEPHFKRSTSRIGFMPNCSHSAIDGGREERKLPPFPTTARALAPKTSCFLCSRF